MKPLLSRNNLELRGMAERGMEPHPIFLREAPTPAASNENHETGEARQVSQGASANEIGPGPRTLTGRSDHPTERTR